MKTFWTIIDPFTHNGHTCFSYSDAERFAKALSKESHRGVEIVRRPIPYQKQKFIVVL